MNLSKYLITIALFCSCGLVSARAVQMVPGEQVSNVVSSDVVTGETTKAVFENLWAAISNKLDLYYLNSNPSNYITAADVETNFVGFSHVVAVADGNTVTNSALDTYETVVISGSATHSWSAPNGTEYNTSSGIWTPSVAGVYIVSGVLNVGDANATPEDVGLYIAFDDNVNPVVRYQIDKYEEEGAGTKSGSTIIEVDGVDDTVYLQWIAIDNGATTAATNVTYTGGSFGAGYLGSR